MAIVLEDLKRLWGLSALYFMFVFFTGPLQMMLRMGNENISIKYTVERFLTLRGLESQAVYSIGFAIILAMLIYRYLHTINSTTAIHGFPIKRKELFHSHNLAGALLILIPVIANMLFLIGLMVSSNDGSIIYQEVFTMQGIMIWTGKTILINIVIYLIATLTAMITGTTIIQGALSFIFIFLPIGLGSLIMVNLDQLVYGFAINNNTIEKFLSKIIPVTAIFAQEEMGIGLLLWYLFLGVVLYISALYLYKIRHLERATDPISLDKLKPIFKYGVTFCAMVLGGAYFYSLKGTDIWLYIGYIIGGYIGYSIADMLIQKTIWVFKNIKGFVIYSLIVIIAFAGIKFDITGFEKRVPEIDNIANAYYGYGVYPYRNGDHEGLKELENIELVQKLHNQMIENKDKFSKNKDNIRSNMVGIAYELKNGRTLYREYLVPREFVQNNLNIKGIFETEEYKKNYNDIFKIDTEKIEFIRINPEYEYAINRNGKVIEKDKIQEMIETIKKDILAESYEEFNNELMPWASIDMVSTETTRESHKDIYLTWQKHYDNLSAWLEENGYEDLRITAEDIDYIVVEKADKKTQEEMEYTVDGSEIGKGKHIEIRDKNQIEYLLYNYERHSISEEVYLLGVYLKNGKDFLGSIDKDRLPEDIKNALN